jgi:uncharacterized protein YcbX
MRGVPHISGLYVYPIKSCRGTALRSAAVGRRGILHDREFMIVDGDGLMLTQRAYPRMVFIAPSIQGEELAIDIAGFGATTVSLLGFSDVRPASSIVWDDTVQAMDQGDGVASFLSGFFGFPCRMVRMTDQSERISPRGGAEVSFADAYPFMGISDASLRELNGRLESPLEMRRFRPNVTFDAAHAFDEDSWLRFSAADITFTGETLCSRCAIPATDQDSGERGKEPGATLARYRRGDQLGTHWKTPHANAVYFGRNLRHSGTGVLRIGDEITVEERD